MKCLLGFLLLIGIAAIAAEDGIGPEPTLPPTTRKTTTTTTTPTTTTTSPTTTSTTPATTTTAPTTTTTTPAPDTTTTPKPTPQPTPPPHPTPAPSPQVGNWTWHDNKINKINKTCIIVSMAMQLNVTYFDKENKTTFRTLNVPSSAVAIAGSCADDEQYIGLKWPSTNNDTRSNTMAITFAQNNTTKIYTMSEVKITLDESELPDFTNESLTLLYTGSEIHAPLKMSYHCTRSQKFNMTEKGYKALSALQVSQLQVEAFHEASNTNFSEAADCDAIDTPDVVPIAVGCALAALVIIVLVAYLVGRRRSQARGYLSM